jgi:glutathione synthase/RimK-type ligase-like ATP-grasp enzyme
MSLSTTKLSTSELLFHEAKRRDLNPAWIIEGGLFAIDTPAGERYVREGESLLNTHISVSLAKNKHLTRAVLARHGVPNIPFARPKSMDEAIAFLYANQKIVVKPYNGYGSQDIRIVENRHQLLGVDVKRYIFERYVAGREMRYLVLNGKVVAVHESKYGVSVQADRDLERISFPEENWSNELTELSVRIANLLGLRFTAVDYLIDADGKHHILEVNSKPGLKWFHAPTSGPAVDVAGLFIQAMLADLSAKQPS